MGGYKPLEILKVHQTRIACLM